MTDLSTQINEQLQHSPDCRGGGFAWETTETRPGAFTVTADCHGCEATIFEVPMTVCPGEGGCADDDNGQ